MSRIYTENLNIPKHRTMVVGTLFLLGFILAAVYGHLNSYEKVMIAQRKTASDFARSAYQIQDELSLQPPRLVPLRFLFGTDEDGRSIFVRMVIGTKAYFLPGMLACATSLILGIVVLGIPASGLFMGKRGRLFQYIPSCIMDALESLPKYITILLALTILPSAPDESITKFYYIVAILGILNSAKIGKLALEKINTLKNREFIEAAEALGLNKWEIIGRHILWSNCLPLFILQASLQMAEVILIEVGLCYLGVISEWGIGVTPSPSWGNILVDGSKYLVREGFEGGWWIVVFPLIVIVSAILIFYFFADEINKNLAARKIALEL